MRRKDEVVQSCNIAPKQKTMDPETALMCLAESYRKGLDSVKNENDWIPADEVDCILQENKSNRWRA